MSTKEISRLNKKFKDHNIKFVKHTSMMKSSMFKQPINILYNGVFAYRKELDYILDNESNLIEYLGLK